jgi:hypothetical protein
MNARVPPSPQEHMELLTHGDEVRWTRWTQVQTNLRVGITTIWMMIRLVMDVMVLMKMMPKPPRSKQRCDGPLWRVPPLDSFWR